MPSCLRFAAPLLAAACTLVTTTYAQNLNALKSATERWIEVRNRISKEQSEWETERSMLESTIETLTSVRDTLSENVEILKLESANLDQATAKANDSLEDLLATNELAVEQVTRFENRILALSKRLPSPLLDKVGPLLRKIQPANAEATPVANRLQNVVAIATLIDEFNNDLTLAHTIRTMEDGEAIEVRVLYWGIASAYASSSDGARAWTLQPSEDGWRWTPARENAVAIRQLFDVYDKTIDPTLVSIPFAFSFEEESE